VNHYERLKVSQDAPPEVIRAAYRALAAKLHPDRQQQGGTETGPDDVMHSQMAALNQAYEVLIDPKLRVAYDATLAPSRPTVVTPAGADSVGPDSSQELSTRVDMDWLTPKQATSPVYWPPTLRTVLMASGVVAVALLLGGGWLYKTAGQHSMERALSDQYVKSSSGEASPLDVTGAPSSARGADATVAERIIERELAAAEKQGGQSGRHRPSVEELSRMSDEELLKVLPTLDNKDEGAESASPAVAKRGGEAAQRQSGRHPLDGKPLGLRTDMQLPEAASAQVAGKPLTH